MSVALSVSEKVVVGWPMGLHFRTSALVVKVADRFQSTVSLRRDRQVANAKSLLDLLTLAAEPGVELEILAEGDDATAAVQALVKLFAHNDETDASRVADE